MAQNEELRNTMKQILVEEQKKEDSSISKLKQRLKRKRTYDQTTFSKRGHEEQFKHTVEVIESLDDVIEALEAGENESALTFIKQERLKQNYKKLEMNQFIDDINSPSPPSPASTIAYGLNEDEDGGVTAEHIVVMVQDTEQPSDDDDLTQSLDESFEQNEPVANNQVPELEANYQVEALEGINQVPVVEANNQVPALEANNNQEGNQVPAEEGINEVPAEEGINIVPAEEGINEVPAEKSINEVPAVVNQVNQVPAVFNQVNQLPVVAAGVNQVQYGRGGNGRGGNGRGGNGRGGNGRGGNGRGGNGRGGNIRGGNGRGGIGRGGNNGRGRGGHQRGRGGFHPYQYQPPPPPSPVQMAHLLLLTINNFF
ncbi:anti-sigma-I factor RsgI-like [Clytia hemisphaerica]|uniref:anti-sigma-I factor RsgI-like n=1 Tax=Clytia hemisphaerica TaxID=252671 RepID=UPI0034D56FB5